MSKIYFKNGERKIPYTIEDFKTKKNLYKNDLIWHEGLEGWKKASEIEELSSLALSDAPLTSKERVFIAIKKSLTASVIFYILFSISIGVFAGLLEKYQYDVFFEKVNENYSKIKKINIPEKKTNYVNTPFNKRSTGYFSDVRQRDFFVQQKDGSYKTRWKYFTTSWENDHEELSYMKENKFMFRPYRAIIGVANLSKEERSNTFVLIRNFCHSSLVTNLFFFPLIFLAFFFYKKKRSL